jgi:hypothetical protein
MTEPGWLTFYAVSRITKWWLGVNEAEARIKLRLACAEQKIQSMKAPCEELENRTRYEDRLQILPIEFWTRVAPSDWRQREVDYDGPDADGCATKVMLNETEFLDWLNKQPPDKDKQSAPAQKKARGKWPRIKALLAKDDFFPQRRVPDPAYCERKDLARRLLKADPALAPLNQGTLKKAIDEYNSGFDPN